MTDFFPYFAVFQIIMVLFIYLFLDYSNFQTFKLDQLAIKLPNINLKLLFYYFCYSTFKVNHCHTVNFQFPSAYQLRQEGL